jgi:hypothetical protein
VFFVEKGDPGVKVVCNDSNTTKAVLANILIRFNQPHAEIPVTLEMLHPEALDMHQPVAYRKMVVERWNTGRCKILVVNRDVPESE